MFSTKSFIVSGLTFMSLIHFEFILSWKRPYESLDGRSQGSLAVFGVNSCVCVMVMDWNTERKSTP